MTLQKIIDWYQYPRKTRIAGGRAQELYFQFHPRTAFLKTLPIGATVADIGAGDGSLSIFRDWPEPARRDLRLYAYSIEKGDRFDAFESYEISDWNEKQPEFDGMRFDAVISAHFIEHIADPGTFVAWLARKLAPGGRAYVEWPSPAALTLPTRSELLEAGVNLVISRFDDDATHRALPDRDAIQAHAVEAGLTCTASGIVRLPWIEDELMAHFRDADDRFPSQAAFWSWTGWSQYLIFEQPLQTS
ncbi:MAG: methyltransferase domain-containing protein [Luteimonas sp.]